MTLTRAQTKREKNQAYCVDEEEENEPASDDEPSSEIPVNRKRVESKNLSKKQVEEEHHNQPDNIPESQDPTLSGRVRSLVNGDLQTETAEDINGPPRLQPAPTLDEETNQGKKRRRQPTPPSDRVQISTKHVKAAHDNLHEMLAAGEDAESRLWQLVEHGDVDNEQDCHQICWHVLKNWDSHPSQFLGFSEPVGESYLRWIAMKLRALVDPQKLPGLSVGEDAAERVQRLMETLNITDQELRDFEVTTPPNRHDGIQNAEMVDVGRPSSPLSSDSPHTVHEKSTSPPTRTIGTANGDRNQSSSALSAPDGAEVLTWRQIKTGKTSQKIPPRPIISRQFIVRPDPNRRICDIRSGTEMGSAFIKEFLASAQKPVEFGDRAPDLSMLAVHYKGILLVARSRKNDNHVESCVGFVKQDHKGNAQSWHIWLNRGRMHVMLGCIKADREIGKIFEEENEIPSWKKTKERKTRRSHKLHDIATELSELILELSKLINQLRLDCGGMSDSKAARFKSGRTTQTKTKKTA